MWLPANKLAHCSQDSQLSLASLRASSEGELLKLKTAHNDALHSTNAKLSSEKDLLKSEMQDEITQCKAEQAKLQDQISACINDRNDSDITPTTTTQQQQHTHTRARARACSHTHTLHSLKTCDCVCVCVCVCSCECLYCVDLCALQWTPPCYTHRMFGDSSEESSFKRTRMYTSEQKHDA